MKSILLIISLLFATNLIAKTDILNVGTKKIKIQEPNELKEISHIKALQPLMKSVGGSTNTVLAMYYDKKFIKHFPKVYTRHPNKWATVLIGKNIENYNATKKNYDETVIYLKQNNDKVFQEVERRLPKEAETLNKELEKGYGGNFNLTLNIPKLLPNTEYEGNTYYGYVYLLQIDEDYIAVGSTVLMYVNQRVISINIYKQFTSKKDIKSLIEESKVWLNNIEKINR